ncbi:unnamed protein product [Ascophyllum nodosum]
MEDDLYGDLNTSAEALKVKSLEAELAASIGKCESLEYRLSDLQIKEKSLRVENEQLARNISSLFNTAKAEIARKDKWIEQLRRELREADERRRGKGRFAAPR